MSEQYKYIITENGELYHYGVLGMKWGVRRYQNKDGTLTPAGKKRLGSWQEKEIDKIKNRQHTRKYVDDLKVNKLSLKLDKLNTLDKNDPRVSKKIEKARKKLATAEAVANAHARIAKAEINKVKNMKISDMNKEKTLVGAAHVGSVLASFGSYSVSAYTGIPVYMVYVPNTTNIKTNMRVSRDKQKQIYNKAYAEKGIGGR